MKRQKITLRAPGKLRTLWQYAPICSIMGLLTNHGARSPARVILTEAKIRWIPKLYSNVRWT